MVHLFCSGVRVSVCTSIHSFSETAEHAIVPYAVSRGKPVSFHVPQIVYVQRQKQLTIQKFADNVKRMSDFDVQISF
jgi:hypothetical protein